MKRRYLFVWFMVFVLGFAGAGAQEFTYTPDAPTMVEGDPGSTVQVDAVIQLTGSNLPAGNGVNGWTVSVSAEGGAVTTATTDGTAVSDLSAPETGFEVTETTTGDDNEGAISAVVLNVQDPTVVLTDETSDIMRLTIETTVPELEVDENGDAVTAPKEVTVRLVDGLQGSGQPVKNRVAFGGVSFVPTFEEATVVVVSNDSGARPLALNQLAQADGELDLGDNRALVFDGELEWASTRESGSWSAMTFTAAGNGNESTLLDGVSLYLDMNGDGMFDGDDEQLGDTMSVENDNAAVAFGFPTVTLDAGSPVRFFLVADVVPDPNATTPSPMFLLPVCLFAVLLRILGRRRPLSGGAFSAWVRPLGAVIVCVGLVFPMACSSGGSSGPPSRQVQFNLNDAGAIELSGTDSGIRGDLGNLPVEGPAVDV